MVNDVEPVPSPEVLALLQKVAELTENFNRVCRIAREYELRAEFAEQARESKEGILSTHSADKELVEELKQKLEEVKGQLEGARKRAENAFTQKLELSRENESLKDQLSDAKTKEKRRELEFSRETEALKDELENAKRKTEEHCRRELELSSEKTALETQLADAKKSIDASSSTAASLVWTNDKLKEEMTEMRRKAEDSESKQLDLSQQNDALKKALVDANLTIAKMHQDSVNNESKLAIQLEKERKQADEERTIYNTRIKELNELLGDYESVPQQQQPQQRRYMRASYPMAESAPPPKKYSRTDHLAPPEERVQQGRAAAMALQMPQQQDDFARRPNQPPTLDKIGHPTNLFQLCCPNSDESVALERACEWVRKSIDKFGRDHIGRRPDMDLSCDLCMRTRNNIGVLDHFLSPGHGEKVRVRGAAVSLAALGHWLEQLQPIKAAAPAAGRKQ